MCCFFVLRGVRKERGTFLKPIYVCLLTLLLLFDIFPGLTGTAYAAELIDSGSISQPYREAVKEMTAHGVLAGFPDGAFHPDETLTREQGTKIVAHMVLGDGVNTRNLPKKHHLTMWRQTVGLPPCITWCVGRDILLPEVP